MKQIIIGLFSLFMALAIVTAYFVYSINAAEPDTTMSLVMLGIAFVVAVVVFILAINQISEHESRLVKVSADLAALDQEYLFSGNDRPAEVNAILGSLTSNLEKARSFVQKISAGDFAIEWEGIKEASDKNINTLSAELVELREQLKKVKSDDERRSWTSEGLSSFAEVARNNQKDLSKLADEALRFLTTHMGAQQGSLFIAVAGEDPHLELASCYAFDKKKHIEKRIELGNGLIGQAYIESTTVVLTDIPRDYVAITSGLGQATPRCLVIVPMKYNNTIAAVAEFASFKKFEPHEVQFLEKAGEIVASAIFVTRTNERTAELLRESQGSSEQLRAQEEELRQNLEELEATQEHAQRQMSEMQILKEQLEKEKYLFSALMDNLPDTIYFKDQQSKLIRVSRHMAKAFGRPMEELLGKSDFDFQDYEHAKEAFDDEQMIMKTRTPKIDFVEREVREDGTEVWVSSTKMPLVNTFGEVVGTFGVSRNISHQKRLEKILQEHKITF
jgi:methyl-accepting chemotaxis protein